jgi:DNA-binding response OmpR family regulator
MVCDSWGFLVIGDIVHTDAANDPNGLLTASRSSGEKNSKAWLHVLVVDHVPAMRQITSDYLADNDLRVTAVATGAEMAGALSAGTIDIVVLDVRLDGEDGMQLARRLHEQSNVPIILVTDRKDEADRVMALELGADDYLTKPFSPRELLARVRAVMRRYKASMEAVPRRDEKLCAYRFLGWELNLRTRRLTAPDGRRVGLSNREFNLLQAFCAAPGRMLSREQLLDLSRLHVDEVYGRSIDVQVVRLRRKIEPDPSEPQYLVTERGVGYRFEAAVEVVYC